MLIYARVTYNIDLVDRCRTTFVDTHLKVDGVVIHIHLDRLNVEEQVTLVGVELAHGIIVLVQTFVQLLEVICGAGLDS